MLRVDSKPKRRLFEVLAGQGMQPNQQVTFLTDGGDDIHDLPRYLNPQAEHLLDWFHLTMRITVLTQLAKGLRCQSERSANITQELQRVKWFLWHGNVFRARQTVDDLTTDLTTDITDVGVESGKLAKAIREFGGYLAANAPAIPNYGERRLAGEIISTSFVESAVNQSSANAWSRSSRCAGVPAARTYYSRSAPASSTTPSPTTTGAGTPASRTPIPKARPRNLPQFVPLS